MSSRNERLSPSERQKASIIFETLTKAKEKFQNSSAQEVSLWVQEVFDNTNDFELEYFQISDASTLTPLRDQNRNYRIPCFYSRIC
jgi:pantoate--beta-alanine ligase